MVDMCPRIGQTCADYISVIVLQSFERKLSIDAFVSNPPMKRRRSAYSAWQTDFLFSSDSRQSLTTRLFWSLFIKSDIGNTGTIDVAKTWHIFNTHGNQAVCLCLSCSLIWFEELRTIETIRFSCHDCTHSPLIVDSLFCARPVPLLVMPFVRLRVISRLSCQFDSLYLVSD